ncbi:MAG: hydroxymethylbilane synthase [Sphingobacteriales bacterium]|nr:hydroxymethylbilane synthase [Sphingobacteriales bacterium]
MKKLIRIGTRESQLAVWQANHVKELLSKLGFESELVYIKSEGDIDLKTPLYEMGVQGIFTRSLDIALLSDKIDIAVHSLKDVPTQLPKGIVQAAVLKRASYKDLLVYNNEQLIIDNEQLITNLQLIIATSSIRRKAQWLNRYPYHSIENLRGNVNTRLKKVEESNWDGAIFAAAGLERINVRPEKSIELDWMLPAPAQGAIVIACKEEDQFSFEASIQLNDNNTALCTKIERDFLRALLGGCSTPISALAEIDNNEIFFRGNILSVDGKHKVAIEKRIAVTDAEGAGTKLANELLSNGGQAIADSINAGK